MNRTISGTGFLISVGLAIGCASANAMTYETHDDVLVISGPISPDEGSKLKEALTPAIKYLVLRSVSGSSASDSRWFADPIEAANVTTVARGPCDGMCARLFLMGKQRMFAAGSKLESTYISLSGYYKQRRGVDVPMDEDSQLIKSRAKLPGALLDKYVYPYNVEKDHKPALVIFHPDAKTPQGSFVGCADRRQPIAECIAIPEITALSTGIITTAELFNSPFLNRASAESK